jgi:hypothetical protein
VGSITIDDALRMQGALARWLSTGDGTKLAHAVNEVLMAFDSAEPPDWERSAREARETADIVARSTLIWCDPPMVDMWAAAADTYPDEPLEEHHLPDPNGIIILAKPLPRVLEPADPDYPKEDISAITWSMTLNGSGVILLTWRRHRGLDQVGWGENPRRTILAPGLTPSSIGVRQIGRQCEGEQSVRLVQALTGLIRSPLVDETTEAGSKAARKDAARAGIAEPRIRRIYLRKPELAAAELQAARDSRAGHAPRGHWVCGHWKRQWHPSIGEHRWIRIEGYPRGDFTAGEVTSPKVHIARGNRRS